MKKIVLIVTAVIWLLLIAGFIFETETKPSPDTRIFLEHTYKTYIAPNCLQESEPSNFILESNLQEAVELGYPPHSECTENELAGEKDKFIVHILKELGVIEKKWDNW